MASRPYHAEEGMSVTERDESSRRESRRIEWTATKDQREKKIARPILMVAFNNSLTPLPLVQRG